MNQRTRLRNLYWNMMTRCYDSSHKSYPRYGGRGITVCAKWRADKEIFFEWVLANGWSHDLQIGSGKKIDGLIPNGEPVQVEQSRKVNERRMIEPTQTSEPKEASQRKRAI